MRVCMGFCGRRPSASVRGVRVLMTTAIIAANVAGMEKAKSRDTFECEPRDSSLGWYGSRMVAAKRRVIRRIPAMSQWFM